MAKEPFAACVVILLMFGFIVSFISDAINYIKTLDILNSNFIIVTAFLALALLIYKSYSFNFNLFRSKSIQQLRNMNPIEFEHYTASLLRSLGYTNVKVTPASNDGGKDIVCNDKNGKKVIVECKRYNKSAIGRRFIQIFHSAMIHERADYGIFVTTSRFNLNAVRYAFGKNIILVDAKKLSEWIAQAN